MATVHVLVAQNMALLWVAAGSKPNYGAAIHRGFYAAVRVTQRSQLYVCLLTILAPRTQVVKGHQTPFKVRQLIPLGAESKVPACCKMFPPGTSGYWSAMVWGDLPNP